MIVPGSAHLMFGNIDPIDNLGRIEHSLRFRRAASAYLTRAVTTLSNRQTWTFSAWVKKALMGQTITLFSAGDGTSNNHTSIRLGNSGYTGVDFIDFVSVGGNTDKHRLVTSQFFRDPSSHFHMVAVLDTTNATAADRIRLYINGVRVTSFQVQTLPTLNSIDGAVNYNYGGTGHRIGQSTYTSELFDGLLSHVAFVDGQALTSDSFGQFHPITGEWRPQSQVAIKAVVDAGGINSFFLPFDDTSSVAALCADASNKGSNFTGNNISLTAGATYDSMVDTPTTNYCTLSPLAKRWAQPNSVLSNGGLTVSNSSVNDDYAFGTHPRSSGHQWHEVNVVAAGSGIFGIGVSDLKAQSDTITNQVLYRSNGQKLVGGTASAYGAAYTTTDVIGVDLDLDASTVTFYKQTGGAGAFVSQGSISLPSTTDITANCAVNNGATLAYTFGQRPFNNSSPPSGAKTNCAKNIPIPKNSAVVRPKKHFDTLLYSGTNGSQNIVGALFRPDLVWLKTRNTSGEHGLWDSLRGVGKRLRSNSTDVEDTISGVAAFNSDGFAVGPDAYNVAGNTYAAWTWKAGAASLNNNGSITSSVSVNAEAGVSIVTYTGTGANATIGHGLGVAPKMVIVKCRDFSPSPWAVWHSDLTATEYLYLQSTSGKAIGATLWNSAVPTSSVINVGTAQDTNYAAKTLSAYCFAEVEGFSKFGKYSGNGNADGPFVNCGFRPAFLMWKRVDSTSDWVIYDVKRDAYNVAEKFLYPNLGSAEATTPTVDILSNGFKVRGSHGSINVSGATHIFAAFAEFPFRYANAR